MERALAKENFSVDEKARGTTKERPQVRTNRHHATRYYGCVVLGCRNWHWRPQPDVPFFWPSICFFYLGLCVLCVDLWFEHLTYYWKIPLWIACVAGGSVLLFVVVLRAYPLSATYRITDTNLVNYT